MRRLIFFALCFLLFLNNAQAQKHEIGAAAGVLNYTGDLSPDYNLRFSRQSLYAFYKRNFNPTWALKASILEGEVYASDAKSKDPLPMYRNILTGSTIVELGLSGEYNFFNYRKVNDRRRFTPYLTGGVAVFTFSQDAVNNPRRTSGTSFSIPFGVGLKYALRKQLNLGFEFVARKTFTDRIDGIETRTLRNGIEGADPYNRDWYYFTGFTFSFTFYSVNCPQSHK